MKKKFVLLLSFLLVFIFCFLWCRYVLIHQYILIPWYWAAAAYFLIAAILFLATHIFQSLGNASKETQMKTLLLFGSLFMGMSVSEIIIRTSGKYNTYSEQRTGNYQSYFCAMEKNWFHVHAPHIDYFMESPEFKYPRHSNSLGYSSDEFVLNKDTGEIRIVTLGDSFTEGDGAPYDSSYPQLLKKILEEKFPQKKFSLLNAGIFGSDLYFDFIGLRERLLQYKPDIVFQMTGSGDLFDIYYRGNMSRFKPDGTIAYNTPPWWEPIYAVCRLSRIFFIQTLRYDGGLVRIKSKEKFFGKEILDLADLFQTYDSLGTANNFKTIVLLKPDHTECTNKEFFNNIDTLQTYTKNFASLKSFNLLNYYLNDRKLDSAHLDKYYWKQDGHHNSDGYKLMAEGAATAVDSLWIESK